MAGNDLVERACELREFARASDEPLGRFMTLAFSGPQDVYRGSADFFLSQMAIPLKYVLSVSKMAVERKLSKQAFRREEPSHGHWRICDSPHFRGTQKTGRIGRFQSLVGCIINTSGF